MGSTVISGKPLGAHVTPNPVGPVDGAFVAVVGVSVLHDGLAVCLDGFLVGERVGDVSVGARVGEVVAPVGLLVGEIELPGLVGATEGEYERLVGAIVGDLEGDTVGPTDGAAVGTVGEVVGDQVVSKYVGP